MHGVLDPGLLSLDQVEITSAEPQLSDSLLAPVSAGEDTVR